MAATINENTQYVDTGGQPIVNGKLYIGAKSLDPKANPITIFSDRELLVVLANPQLLDASGRSTNKIWIPGEYSFRVDNSNDVQQIQDLDAGSAPTTGITSLQDVAGINTITAKASITITSYIDKEIYIMILVNPPTDAVTLEIDSLGAKAVVKQGGQPIVEGDGKGNGIWVVAFNLTNDNFELQNDTSNVVDFYEGTDVASAATADIWAIDGNTVHLTGTTGVTAFSTAPNVGAKRRIICDDVITFTNSANLALQGGDDFTSEAGDILNVYADTTTQFDVTIDKIDGTAVVSPQSFTQNVFTLFEGLVNKFVTITTADIDANAVLLKTTAGKSFRAESVNVTVDITVSGVDGLDTGSEASSTWYFLWVIFNETTISGLLSISSDISSITFPSGYTFAGLVGAVFNDSGSDFDDFHQVGNRVVVPNITVISNGSATSITAVNLSAVVPPIATVVTGYMGASSSGGALGTAFLYGDAAGILGEISVSGRNSSNSKENCTFKQLITVPSTTYYNVSSSDSVNIIASGWEV